MLSWIEIVQNYIIKYSNRIKKTTQPLSDHFGIEYFTYHRIDNSGKYTVLVDRPDWAEHYVSEQFYLVDPYLRHPSTYKSGLTLLENHGSENYKTAVLKAAKEQLNMDLGVILIEKNASGVEFFGFSGSKQTSSLESLYLNHPQLLNSFAAHFKKELSPILIQMEPEANSLQKLKGMDYFSNQLVCPEIPSMTRHAYYRDLGLELEAENAEKLSQRERQCLKLLLQGKSSKETAVVLKLSPRTIEYYFENIKDKLSCWSKNEVFQAAKRFDELGIL